MELKGKITREKQIPQPRKAPVRPLQSSLSNASTERWEFHIDELVLHGFAPADRHRIGDAVQAELTRLASEPGQQNASSLSIERLGGIHFRVAKDGKAKEVGEQLARAIYGEFVRSMSCCTESSADSKGREGFRR